MIELVVIALLAIVAVSIVLVRFVPTSYGIVSSMDVILTILSALYVAYVVIEHFHNEKQRKKIGKVIHVNGIRGKSTVTRLIDAGLREFGYKVIGKTTGTVPTVIGVDNKPVVIKRLGKANIREQLKIVDKAGKENADFLVVECMAVNPELQFVSEHRILHADINVITNVRADHLDEMGEDLESIAYSLANTTPNGKTLVLGEDKYKYVFTTVAKKLGTNVVVADEYRGSETLDTFPENIATALKVCDVLGLDREKFFNGMKKYIHDPGALSVFTVGNTQFVNGFSINDPDSILLVYQQLANRFEQSEMTVVLNERPDRPFRIDQHIEMLTKMQFKKLYIFGSNKTYVKKKLLERGITAQEVSKTEQLLEEKCIFGCGNIADDGMKIIDFFKKQGQESEIFPNANGGNNG